MPFFSPDHIHPILVNFTAALVPASVGSDVCGRIFRKPALHVAAWWMLLYATAITPFTGLAGLWWKKQMGTALPADIVLRHQWLGIGLAVLFVVLAIWRGLMYRDDARPPVSYLVAGLMAVAALAVQGTLGGAMLFGS